MKRNAAASAIASSSSPPQKSSFSSSSSSSSSNNENYLQYLYKQASKRFRVFSEDYVDLTTFLFYLFSALVFLYFGYQAGWASWSRADVSNPYNDIANMNVNELPTTRLYFFSSTNSNDTLSMNSYEKQVTFGWKKLIEDHCVPNSVRGKNATFRTNNKNAFVSCIFVDCSDRKYESNPEIATLILRFNISSFQFPCLILDLNPSTKTADGVNYIHYLSTVYDTSSIIRFLEKNVPGVPAAPSAPAAV